MPPARVPPPPRPRPITSPEAFFGFRLGSDRNFAAWDKIVEYYRLLGRESDKIKVVDMGPSTMGNPFLLVVISSPENLARLEELRLMNLRLSDPRGLDEPRSKNSSPKARPSSASP